MRNFQLIRPFFASLASKSVALRLTAAVFCCTVFCYAVLGQIDVTPAWAANFMVENKVFSGSEKQPCSQSTTIFKDGVVYDYLVDPANPSKTDEVTVFDFAHGRFLLLDKRLKLKTELSTRLVKASVDSLKTRTDLGNDPFASFLLNPRFEQEADGDSTDGDSADGDLADGDSVDGESGELLFSSKWLDYRVLTSVAKSPEIAADYRRFSDWYARLNTYIRRGVRPPFARMLVNEELGKRGELPREVHLTLKPKQGIGSRKFRLHSEHRVTPRLGDGDQRRVAQTAEDLTVFETVGFKEYNKKRAAFESESRNK